MTVQTGWRIAAILNILSAASSYHYGNNLHAIINALIMLYCLTEVIVEELKNGRNS